MAILNTCEFLFFERAWAAAKAITLKFLTTIDCAVETTGQ